MPYDSQSQTVVPHSLRSHAVSLILVPLQPVILVVCLLHVTCVSLKGFILRKLLVVFFVELGFPDWHIATWIGHSVNGFVRDFFFACRRGPKPLLCRPAKSSTDSTRIPTSNGKKNFSSCLDDRVRRTSPQHQCMKQVSTLSSSSLLGVLLAVSVQSSRKSVVKSIASCRVAGSDLPRWQ